MGELLHVLVTGASGFVGRRLLSKLTEYGNMKATGTVRSPDRKTGENVVVVGDLNESTDWSEALYGNQVVIHTAARVPVMNEVVADSLIEFRRVNVAGTQNLARQAADAGIRRFIYISSIKVNGETTVKGSPFHADGKPAPEDAYGLSKLEAELALQKVATEAGMELVIIRPPLIYGPGVKGNFASMIKLVERGMPLPLGNVRNLRSLIGLDNLVDLIITCIDHPSAANQVFMASDSEDVSASELLRRVAKLMGKPSRLIPVPAGLLRLGATMLGKKAVAHRLLGSLQVDIAKTRELLGWVPPFSVSEGLRRCFISSQD